MIVNFSGTNVSLVAFVGKLENIVYDTLAS